MADAATRSDVKMGERRLGAGCGVSCGIKYQETIVILITESNYPHGSQKLFVSVGYAQIKPGA